MTRSLPPVWLAPGAVTDPRALARFAHLDGIPVVVGPVEAGAQRVRTGRSVVHGSGVGGLEYEDTRPIPVAAAQPLLGWASARGLGACVVVRGRRGADLAAAIEQLRRSVEADAVVALEVDLRTADDQTVLKSMARVREAAPRDLLLLTRLATSAPDLVGRARAAVAGGAGSIVVCGQVPLGAARWWAGPSTAAHTRAGLRLLSEAREEQRWPGVPLIASGGIHGPASVAAAVADGADAVQLGTALWADPTLIDPVREAVRTALDHRMHDTTRRPS